MNGSPDPRQRINGNPQFHPKRRVRHGPIASVVLADGNLDHVAGQLILHESHRLAVYATQRVLTVLAENRIFNALDPELVERRGMRLGSCFELETRDWRPIAVDAYVRFVRDARRFKTDVLWTQLDALHFAYVEPGLIPPGAFVPGPER